MSNRQEPFKRITAEEAKGILESGGDNVQLVDVRELDEYVAGHIPGALLMPVNSVYSRVGELSKEKDVIFLCSVGQRSALACEIAAAMGYTKLSNVEGGTDSWSKKGYPLETGGPPSNT